MLSTEITRLKFVELFIEQNYVRKLAVYQERGARKKKEREKEAAVVQLTPGFRRGVRSVVGKLIDLFVWGAVEAVIGSILPQLRSIEVWRRNPEDGEDDNGKG